MKLGSWILGSGTLMAVSEPANALVAAWSGPGVPLLAVTALGDNLPAAAELAHAGVACIRFDGAQHRSDIARATAGAAS